MARSGKIKAVLRAVVIALADFKGTVARQGADVPVKLLNERVGRQFGLQPSEKRIEHGRQRFDLDHARPAAS